MLEYATRFSLSSRLPPLVFRTISVLGMMWMWDVASVSRLSRGAVVPRLGLASVLVRLGLVSVSSSEGLGLGLASAWIVSVSVSASVSGFKVSVLPHSRLKSLMHISASLGRSLSSHSPSSLRCYNENRNLVECWVVLCKCLVKPIFWYVCFVCLDWNYDIVTVGTVSRGLQPFRQVLFFISC